MTRPRIAAVALAVAAVGASLCSVGAAGPRSPAAGAASLPKCPTAALAKAKGPVNISFWESMNRTNGVTLTKLTDQFNASQSKIHVTLVDQNSYTTTWTKYQAGLTNGQLPAVAQLQDVNLQGAIDTQSILPAQSCINASKYQTTDFVPRALAYWKADGIQQAMPFAVSNPIVYYNKQAFTAAGLTPTKPPATLGQYVADAAALKAHGSGVGLKLDPWHLETWLATANTLFVNNANGRKSRATKAVLAGKNALKVFTALDTMVSSGDAATNPYTGPDEFDNLLGIGSGKFGMTIDTSAALGTIATLLNSGQYPNVTLGIGSFPVLTTKRKGGVEPGGSALYISNKVPAAQQAAAWQYITYLDTPASQATWAAGTGYIPIRKSSAQTTTIQNLWTANPGFKVAYQQLVTGATTPATAGAVIGPFPTVRTDELTAEKSMYTNGVSPAKAVAGLTKSVDTTLANYNQRLGVT